ncbi:MAG: hypothetical protein LBT24_00595 [Tannerella sp.]|jgi:archaellum component FlaC|nr:hypothetical protein [Tannerella sp.]
MEKLRFKLGLFVLLIAALSTSFSVAYLFAQGEEGSSDNGQAKAIVSDNASDNAGASAQATEGKDATSNAADPTKEKNSGETQSGGAKTNTGSQQGTGGEKGNNRMQEPAKVTVAFYMDSTTITTDAFIERKTYNVGETIKEPEVPTPPNEGTQFDGWLLEDEETLWVFSTSLTEEHSKSGLKFLPKWGHIEEVNDEETQPQPQEELNDASNNIKNMSLKFIDYIPFALAILTLITIILGVLLLLFVAKKSSLVNLATKEDIKNITDNFNTQLQSKIEPPSFAQTSSKHSATDSSLEINRLKEKIKNLEITKQQLESDAINLKRRLDDKESEVSRLKETLHELKTDKQTSAEMASGLREPKDEFNKWAENPMSALPKQFYYTTLPKQLQMRTPQAFNESNDENSPWIANRVGDPYLFPNPRVLDMMTDITTFYKGGTGFTKPKGQNRLKIIKGCKIKKNDCFVEFAGELIQI